jgi:hypothetical protein
MQPDVTRRHFLALLSLALLPAVAGAETVRRVARAISDRPRPKHPDPRPGITSAGVLTAGKLHDQHAASVFDMVREIPQIVDGIRCSCGCADTKGYYSLLSCYEAPGMAQHCDICQGQARLAHKLHEDGWSLGGIRRAIDAQFGD